MITFIIPVKSKRVSASWESFSKIFERTLRSVTNQTSQNFKVLVVCHEKPETNFVHPNVEYIHVDFDPPQLATAPKEKHDGLKEEDKSRKILAGVAHSEKRGTNYLMVVDADDLISNKIAAFVEKNSNTGTNGWYFRKGYIYREGAKYISLNKENFNTLCGTCIIIKATLIKQIFKQVPHLLYVHKTTGLENGIKLDALPFSGSVYSIANGENHYMNAKQIRVLTSGSFLKWSTIVGVFRKLKKYNIYPLSKRIRQEFGMYQLSA